MANNHPDRSQTDVERVYRQASGSPAPARKRPTAQQIASRKKAAKKRRIALIALCCVVLVILIGAIVALILSSNKPKDDGRILNNVCAAGVDLGGMTVDEAKSALHLATDNALLKKDMTVNLPGTSFTLSPADAGIRLDVDAVVQAAYNYGRTGSEEANAAIRDKANSTIHTIALLPYMKLDLPYIQKTIGDFCSSYSSVITDPSAILKGDRPAFDPEYPDLVVDHQTLVITMGTPDYALNADKIYDMVLDAYSLNQLTVTYQPPAAKEPPRPDAQKLFSQFCLAPVDASMDEVTFDVTPEIYGYGFDISSVQKKIDNAGYGEVIEIPLDFIMPAITAEDLTENLFQDTLATYVSIHEGSSNNWNVNLQLSCDAINGLVIKAGEEFSFNTIIGRPTTAKGYKKAAGFLGGKEADIIGAGIEQTAATLYYCALMADLNVTERHSNGYAVSYIGLGLDARIDYGSQDLRIQNNTTAPIRITAIANEGQVYIQLFGVDEKDYSVEITTEITKQNDPTTKYQVMDKDNVLGYKSGDVLQTGITGYTVNTGIKKFHKQTGELLSTSLLDTSTYSKRDQIVVLIGSDQPVVTPTEPSTPSDPSDPTAPSEGSLLDGVLDFIGGLF